MTATLIPSGLLSERLDTTTLPCQDSAAADLFFAEAPADLERAKALCAGCPLQAECRDGALARREPWGVWGGEILIGGEIVARKRPRGRPCKRAVEQDAAA